MFPIPKDAITANTANNIPRKAPIFLFLKPFFMVYIGPPDISPFSLTSRYFMANIHSLNFDVKPKHAEIHIHTKAPGPPDTMAVATPTMLPVPIVAARAVVSAEKGDTSPSPLLVVLASLLNVLLMAKPRFLHGLNFNLIVRKIPVPTSSTNITGPQTKSSTFTSVSEIQLPTLFQSIIFSSYFLFLQITTPYFINTNLKFTVTILITIKKEKSYLKK